MVTQFCIAQNSDYILLEAAEKGEIDVIEKMHLDSVKVNVKNIEGVTPLMFAAENGHTKIVKLLVNKGADINIVPKYSKVTPLIAAVKNNHVEIVEFLLKNNANANDIDEVMQTPLIYAAAYGYPLAAEILLRSGANPDLAPNYETPLSVATFYNDSDLVKILLTAGANPNLVDKKGFTPIMTASQKGNIKNIKLLLNSKANIQMRNNQGYTALDLAVIHGETDALNLLIENGAKVNNKINSGTSTRELAILMGEKSMSQTLRKAGAKRSYIPSVNTFVVSSTYAFNTKNFYMNYEFTAGEDRYGVDATFGYSIRPFRKKVLIKRTENQLYQFKEFRNGFYLGLNKRFRIYKQGNTERGILLGVKEAYYFGGYSGVKRNFSHFTTSPVAGIYFRNPNTGISLCYEHTNMQFENSVPGLINLTFSLVWKDSYHYSSKYLNID